METMGQRLRMIRAADNMSQQEFANKYDTSQRLISKYETDQLGIPDELKIKLLQNGLNIAWLFTGVGSMVLGKENNIDRNIRTSKTASIKDDRSENERLRAELEATRAELEACRADVAKLAGENEALNKEIMDKMRRLLGLQDKLLNLKEV